MTKNEGYISQAAAHIQEFELELEPQRFNEVYLALENVQPALEADPHRRSQLRKKALYLWLKLLQVLDHSMAPNFDVNDVPTDLVQPPPTKDGVVYPPGADPSLIDDPKARAAYEEEILANRKKIDDYRLQLYLSRQKERIPERAQDFIRSNYSSAELDKAELRKAIRDVITDPHRKAEFEKLLLSLHP